MTEEEKLEVEINLLKELNYVTAYTGSLDNIKTKSYVLYADVTKLINEKLNKLIRLKKG